jgi:hypothetical protein
MRKQLGNTLRIKRSEAIHPLGQALARSAIQPTAGRGFLASFLIKKKFANFDELKTWCEENK